jgi:hypothetical protein
MFDINELVKQLYEKIESEFKLGIKNTLSSIGPIIEDVDEKTHQLVNTFGAGDEMVLGIKKAITESVSEVQRLGGSFDDVVNIQQTIATTLNRNLILLGDTTKELYTVSKITGKDSGTLARNFKDAGYSLSQIGSEMETVVNTARSIGVNVQDVSSKVLGNLKYLDTFTFEGGVKGLAKMAAQASNLRADMDYTTKLADDLLKPENAIELAASLQRLGATQSALLDPLKLMDLAQNNVGELQNQVAELAQTFVKFNEQTGRFEIPAGARRQAKEIANSLGYGYDEFVKMGKGMAELETKMSQIRFPNFNISEDDKKLIANMSELSTSGEYKVKFFDTDKKTETEVSINKLTESQFEMLKKMGEPKNVETLAEQQLSYMKQIESHVKSMLQKPLYATASSVELNKNMADMAKFTNVLSKSFSNFKVSDISNALDKGVYKIFNMLEGILSGDTSKLKEFITSIEKTTQSLDKELLISIKKLKLGIDSVFGGENDSIMTKMIRGATNQLDSLINKELGKAQRPTRPTRTATTSTDFIYDSENKIRYPFERGDLVNGVNKTSLVNNLSKQESRKTNTKMEFSPLEIVLNVKIDAPNVDQVMLTKTFKEMINTNEIQQTIITHIKKAEKNYGLT